MARFIEHLLSHLINCATWIVSLSSVVICENIVFQVRPVANEATTMKKILVGVIVGSKSDLLFIEETIKLLKSFKIPYELKVLSAHRNPAETSEYAEKAEKRGIEVIIAAAGLSAHLAGALAARTILPVIGVPVPSEPLRGIDSFLSTLQMPSGVPVATMSIGKSGAKNSAILAAKILALKYPQIKKKLKEYKKNYRLHR